MFEKLKELFQAKALLKNAYAGNTSLMPLDGLKSATIIFDVEDTGFNDCKEEMISFLRSKGIRSEVYFFDFRHLEKDELLLTSIQTTVLRKDLNWFGMPAADKMNLLGSKPHDLFISMVGRDSFANRIMSAAAPARFKIGRCAYEGNPYDLVISGNRSVSEIFALMKESLLKIIQ